MKLRGLTRFIAATIGIAVLCFGSPDAGAVESSTTKIATVNIQEVLLGSTAGQEVKKMLEAKVDELQGKFKKE
jgi:Skp family chaperone for outer membrane proteins